MVAPFNYMLTGMDPVLALQNGMAFGQQQRQGEQQIDMNAQTMDLRAQQEARDATMFDQQNTLFAQGQEDRASALEAQRAQLADLSVLSDKIEAGTVTSDDFGAVAAKYPDLADEMSKMWEGRTKERKDADVANLYKGIAAIQAGRPDIAIDMLEERAVAAENADDQQEADIARAMAAAIKADPAGGVAALGMLLQVTDPEAAAKVFGSGRSVQSTKAYANGTTVTVFTDGSKEVTDAAGVVLEGPAAIAAAEAAMASEADMRGANAAAAEAGKLESQIDKATEAEAAKEAGKQAIAKSGEAFDSLNKVAANMVTIDTAIAALDEGANSGVIAKYFPDVTAASAELTNAMNRLGLDVIGSVTFGALSEGEMRLAMETAVPRNLSEPDLREWLVRKKEAQQKAAEALNRAAIYLGTPGNTLAKWLESKGQAPSAAGDQGSQAGGVPADIQGLLDTAPP